MRLMMRIFAILFLVVAVLTSTGCVTRSSRDWGYVDRGAPSYATVQPIQQPYQVAQPIRPITPSAIVPNSVGDGCATGPLQVPTYSYATPSTRQTYEHNHESFSMNDIVPWVFLGIMGTDLILRHSHGHHGRWHRGWWR